MQNRSSDVRVTNFEKTGPQNRQSRIIDAAMRGVLVHPEHRDSDQIAVAVSSEDDDGERRSAFITHGYGGTWQGTAQLIIDLLEHAKAVLISTGAGTMEFHQIKDHEMRIDLVLGRDKNGPKMRELIIEVLLTPEDQT